MDDSGFDVTTTTVDVIAEVLEVLGLAELSDEPAWRALVVFCAFVLIGSLVDLVLRSMRRIIATRTTFTADDLLIDYGRRPLFLTFVLSGAWYGIKATGLPQTGISLTGSVLATVAILVWTQAFMRLGHFLLQHLSARSHEYQLVQDRTLPLFELLVRGVVIGSSGYALMLAWHIDVTAWLASAGVLGIAIGFAAQETLANVLAGIVIIADAPYKLGDFLVLDSGQRGRVTQIGMRSTRMLTEDNIEIVVPNSVMVGATITNESGGDSERERVGVDAGVAYGSDIERVREILLDVAGTTEGVIIDDPTAQPAVQFRAMGASSLDFKVLVWIDRPEDRWPMIDRLTTNIYTRLNEEGIEIPFPKRDVYLYDMGKEGEVG